MYITPMTRARKEQIDLNQTPYYHCICRCVRRAFLCGEDHLTGKNYDHRKAWIVDRLALLSQVFSFEIASYSIMSNHYHVLLRVDRDTGLNWDDETVAKRWKQLYSWPLLVENYLKGNTSKAETMKAQEIIQTWRKRLIDIPWFMRCLNEYLGRRANKEDQCTGRFWEGRYKSQALLGDAAVLTCMSYVDLNPIRANMANTPEDSDYTSIQQRINTLQRHNKTQNNNPPIAQDNAAQPINVKLMPLVKQSSDRHPNAIGYTLKDYLELIDWVGRSVRNDKRGSIDDKTPPILQRLGLNVDGFLEHVLTFEEKPNYPCANGPLDKLKALASHWKQIFIKGQYALQRIYQPG